MNRRLISVLVPGVCLILFGCIALISFWIISPSRDQTDIARVKWTRLISELRSLDGVELVDNGIRELQPVNGRTRYQGTIHIRENMASKWGEFSVVLEWQGTNRKIMVPHIPTLPFRHDSRTCDILLEKSDVVTPDNVPE